MLPNPLCATWVPLLTGVPTGYTGSSSAAAVYSALAIRAAVTGARAAVLGWLTTQRQSSLCR
jgi:hypothetical protein